ncbi:hypothetical protein [Luteimonas sp. gir]|uniref:hypothetical protein n=1 Tax=Luteimonas sp. gir TaxID=3127960 RepID=UPI003075D125
MSCAYYRLSKTRARTIVEEVRVAVRGWRDQARHCQARGTEIAAMEAVIDPER